MLENTEIRMETERLILRPLILKDCADLEEIRKEVNANPANVPYCNLSKQGDALAFYNRAKEQEICNPRETVILGVVLKDTAKLIGFVEFELGKQDVKKWGKEKAFVDQGYVIHPKYQQKGYAVEASRALLGNLCFGFLGYDYAVASSHPDNKISHNILYALGYEVYNDNAFMYGTRRLQFGLSREKFYEAISREGSPKNIQSTRASKLFINGILINPIIYDNAKTREL